VCSSDLIHNILLRAGYSPPPGYWCSLVKQMQ
jgi:hypothetical protein